MHDLEKQINKIMDKANKEVEGFITFEVLFNKDFMDRNTNFLTIEEFLNFHEIKVNTMDEFESICTDILDKAVINTTKFSSWKDMSSSACKEYVRKKLRDAGFNIVDVQS